MPPELMLAQLVAFRSIVGHPNAALIDSIRDYLTEHGVPSAVIGGPEGDRFNLFASIGPAEVPGYILSGHVDVVPANEPQWQGDPFDLRERRRRLIGRGACDMKGFVAAVLSAVPELVRMKLRAPIHIALSYDEEAGCRGVRHMIKRLPSLCAQPLGCIVGEPSNLTPVLRHKGKAAIRVSAQGISGHSSRPDLGRNAIHLLVPALQAAVAEAKALESGPQDAHFEPPYSTLQVGVLRGGEAINILPDAAEALIEARAIPGSDPEALFAPIRAAAADPDLSVELMTAYPALSLDEDHPLAALTARLSGQTPLAAVSFGTEAGLFQEAGVPSVICGPGDISRAHKAEEYITIDELHAARDMVLGLGRTLAAE
ncbi:acetylornithine deacetylase [Salipiger abyssi]|uniref:acetylornithine deacetylase n=1 Tax=Salipiger abyssi TaxID=1250539 RepID=UPI0040588654